MRRQLFIGICLALFAGLVFGTRFGDILIYTTAWTFCAITLVVFAAWCLYWFPDHRLVPLSADWTSVAMIASIIFLAVLSPYSYGAQAEVAKLGSAFLLGLMIMNITQERNDRQVLMNSILFIGMGISALSFAYYMAYSSPLFFGSVMWNDALQSAFVGDGILFGLWQYHNTFGAFLVLCILLSIGLATGERRRDWRLLYDVCSVFLLMVLYLTTSRGAFLMLAVGIVALVVLSPVRWRKRVVFRIAEIFAFAAGLTLFNRSTLMTAQLNAQKQAALGTFIAGGADQSNQTRVHLIVLGARLFRSHFLTGTGLGTFFHVWTAFEWVPDVARRIDPHSLLFRFLAETGLLGTVPLFTWIGYRGIYGIKKIFSAREDMAYTGLWVGTLAFFLHMCMDVDYVYPVSIVILFFCLALLSARTNVAVKEENVTVEPSLKRRIISIVAAGIAIALALVPMQRGYAGLYTCFVEGADTGTQIEHYTDAASRDPSADMYWFRLGNAYANALSGGVSGPVTDSARSAFVKAEELAPEDYHAWFYQGMMELNLKNPAAITCLERAEQLYPTLALIKGWLALSYVYVANDTTKAETKAAEAEAITPGESYAVTARAFCALSRHDVDSAKELLKTVVKQGFINKFAYYGLSLCYRFTGNSDQERFELTLSHRINRNLVEAEKRLRSM